MTRKQVSIPDQFFQTRVLPETLNVEKRTIDVVFSTGAQVKRFSFMDGEFTEELAMGSENVRLGRFNNGAPLLNNHNRFSGVESVIGVLENARMENGEGIATVRYSEREDVEPIFQDVKNDILRNYSVGYRVHTFEERFEDGKRILRATDWEPTELSLVTIPADPGAQSRSSDNFNSCEILMEVREMKTDPNAPAVVTPEANPTRVQPVEAPSVDTDKIRAEAAQQERTRASEINTSVRALGLDDSVAQKFVEDGTSIEEVRKEIIALSAKTQEDGTVRTENVKVLSSDKDHTRAGMADALSYRSGSVSKPTDQAKRFVNMTAMQMARYTLDDHSFALSPNEVAKRAFHSTSDFSVITEDAAKKSLRSAYIEADSNIEAFSSRSTTNDFKDVKKYQLGEFSSLIEKPEGGEYKNSTMGQGKETNAVKTFGRSIAFTREMLINDDLSAFNKLPSAMAMAARRLELDKVWNVLINNPTMGDANALFSGAHNNDGAAAALSDASLKLGRQAMRQHKGLDDEARLNYTPFYLAVGTGLEHDAEKLVSSVSPTSTSEVNPWAPNGRTPLQLIVEPRLDDIGTAAWFLFTSPGQAEMIDILSLTGEQEPTMERKEDFDTDGIKWKVRHEIGVAPVDYRGFYRNIGV